MKCSHPECRGNCAKVVNKKTGLGNVCYQRDWHRRKAAQAKTKPSLSVIKGKKPTKPPVPREQKPTPRGAAPPAAPPPSRDIGFVQELVDLAATCTRIADMSIELAKEYGVR